jgi:parallel beta-helix repeat protein
MKTIIHRFFLSIVCLGLFYAWLDASEPLKDFSPGPEEKQLPLAMHSSMKELPSISVGHEKADLIGKDNRVLQAAVDYISGLGGGTVEIRAGRYEMYDSLHLRSNVKVRGKKGLTILHKAKAAVSLLALDGDFGEQQITLVNPEGFNVGCGVTVRDDKAGGFHTTVARITGRNGNTFSIDKPLMADCMTQRNAKAATVFPVISGYNIVNTQIEGITVEGDKESNPRLNGCRGAGLFLYRGFGTVIKDCTIKNYNGDGISFQQSNDVKVISSTCEANTGLGLHPGSGSQRPVVRKCISRKNGEDGLFLCWRVRHGVFESNLLEGNKRFGISIGHKDSDNLLQNNTIRLNCKSGVFFRNETLGMGAHRNQLIGNVIENNSTSGQGAGIRIRGETNGLILKGNTIRDTRQKDKKTQTVGIIMEEHVGTITIENNKIDAETDIIDKRKK